MRKKLHGVGFISSGKYKSKIKNKQTKEYIVWKHMIARCYESDKTRPKRNFSYKDCVVCEEWHDFQNFAEWYDQNYNKEEKMHLDKDILIRNNKVYSPQTCILIPEKNKFILFAF